MARKINENVAAKYRLHACEWSDFPPLEQVGAFKRHSSSYLHTQLPTTRNRLEIFLAQPRRKRPKRFLTVDRAFRLLERLNARITSRNLNRLLVQPCLRQRNG